ncbi:MAG TPA: hypothetical protein VMV10_08065 [Pirellulales bacterium]|nr:hypothetical protein [Pirellulales bacterium]
MYARSRYSPGWGLSWQLWRRHRWGFLADIAWLAALALAANLWPESWRWPRFGQNLELGGLAVFIHLIAAFSYGFEVDLTANKRSGFPTSMFTLPLTTRTLVAWPIELGAAAMTVVWLVIALGISHPCGIEAPLAFPAVVAVAVLMAIQAVSWAPFEFGWARVAVALPTVLAVLFSPLLATLVGFPERLIPVVYLALLPGLFLAAVAGVARARRGDAFDWRWHRAVVQLAARLLPERRRPFASAAQAQLWFECRRHAGLLPLFVAMLLIPIAMILFLGSDRRGDWAKALSILGIALALPVFLAAVVSAGLGKHDFSATKSALPAFLATRPIRAGEFVAAKFKMAAVGTLVTWILTLMLPAAWLLAPGHFETFSKAFAQWARDVSPGKLAAGVALAVVFLPAFTWKKLVDGMFIGLSGRNWVVTANAIVMGSFLCAAIPVGLVLEWLPEYRPLAWRLLPWLVGAAILAKSLAAVFILRALWQSKLVAHRSLQKYLAVWCLVTIALAGSLVAIAPTGSVSVWAALAGAVLLVPLNRLTAAPLALNWDRHR